jgi:2-polyprenyl-3-methyl-5-hydroxy-6-metoxy-1,4-benzoquinol methylase
MVEHEFPELQSETLQRMSSADHYNAWLVERSLPYLGTRVLDLGAGIGTFTSMLVGGGRQVVALEPDPALRPTLERRFAGSESVQVLPHTVESLAGAGLDEPFDSVVCFNVLEHIDDDLEALRTARRLLRPGGALLLLVPAHPVLYGAVDRAVAHRRRYRREPLRRLLTGAGMTVSELRYVNPVGAVGWLVSSRFLQREHIPAGPLSLYDRLVPGLRRLDRLRLPFGLSLWAVSHPS